MRFYYGADRLVLTPLFNEGNPSNDYGRGFYLTENKELARLWACQYPNGGYLIEYEVDITGLNILRLATIEDEDVLRWLSLLISHRFSREERNENRQNIEWLEKNYPLNIENYDAIIGYRADDSYFAYSRDFVRNELSLELLKDAMRLGKLGTQFVLISEKAFQKIKYIDSIRVKHSDEYQDFRTSTKHEYFKMKQEDDINNTFLRDIMRRRK